MSRVVFAILFLLAVSQVLAQQTVVVIPLGDSELEIEPTAPMARADTVSRDYTILPNTVIDNLTGLEWQRLDDDTTREWIPAISYCRNLVLDSHSDWRLPTVVELHSIVDYGSSAAAIEQVAFPGTNSSLYWSRSVPAGSAIGDFVNFNTGGINDVLVISAQFLVRCVREPS
ncbi:MAG: DUF1566 domain-containing protein [Pseudomonadota bacterium]